MASLKDLKQRIKSIKSIQQITKSMQLIAISRLGQFKSKLPNADQYIEAIKFLLGSVLDNNNDLSVSNYKWGEYRTKDNGSSQQNSNARLIILITSDKGLCGQFNTSLINMVKQEIETYYEQHEIYLICIGKKGYETFKNDHRIELIGDPILLPPVRKFNFNYVLENTINPIIELLTDRDFDFCRLVYTHFFSTLRQVHQIINLFPVTEKEIYDSFANSDQERSEEELKKIYRSKSECIYEPDVKTILRYVISLYQTSALYNGLLHSIVSEYAARTVAMDNATRNSDDMLENLIRLYNKNRQSIVTRELTEIISGTEAMS